MIEELPLCECGCGKPVRKKGHRFINGHNPRGKKQSPEHVLNSKNAKRNNKLNPKPKPVAQLCECGCGQLTKPGNIFVNGHNNTGNTKPKPDPQLCKCGCGELSESGNDYIHGHNRRGRDFSIEHIKNLTINHADSLKEKGILPNGWEVKKDCKLVTNKTCSKYLGCYITEQILSKIYSNVQVMPPNNHGFDFYCAKKYKIDAKSSATGYKDRWQFNIKKNTIADYFLCLAFEDRNSFNPSHLWLIPGQDVNHQIGITISKSTLQKWSKYEQLIDPVIECCNKIKGE